MRLLGKDLFILRGSHQTLSPCTLPKWAPESVAHNAIQYYRERLRDGLEKIMQTSTALRSRTRVRSTQSDSLSGDSHEDQSHNFSTKRYNDYPGPKTSLAQRLPWHRGRQVVVVADLVLV